MSITDAVEVVAARDPQARCVLSCEHASERLPPGWQWPDADAHLRGTHWAHDRGAAILCRALAEQLGAAAVLANFSRLFVDANRPLDSETLFRSQADGLPVALNQQIGDSERALRLRYWHTYHRTMTEVVREQAAASVIFSIHSFTPVYEGRRRSVAIGVLFEREQALAEAMVAHLAPLGLDVRLNEPYSGQAGLIDSPLKHANAAGRRALELEVRQDLLEAPPIRNALTQLLATFAF